MNRFDAKVESTNSNDSGRSRGHKAYILLGCGMAILAGQPHSTPERVARSEADSEAKSFAAVPHIRERNGSGASTESAVAVVHPDFEPIVRVALPKSAPAKRSPDDEEQRGDDAPFRRFEVSIAAGGGLPLNVPIEWPTALAEPLPLPTMDVRADSPHAVTPTKVLQPESKPPGRQAAIRRSVYIEQISHLGGRTVHIAQLQDAPAAAESEDLPVQIAAMQVSAHPEQLAHIAPSQISEEARARFLTEAPARMAVRIGEDVAGRIAIRSSTARSFDVKLGELLNLVSAQMPAEEFERLNASAATDQFVSFDRLREMGIGIRYDAVYDELRLSS